MGPIRIQFFLTYAVLAAVGVYIPVLLGDLLKGHEFWKGIILAINGPAIIISPVLMAWMADAKVPVRRLLAGSFAVAGAGALCLAGVVCFGGGLHWAALVGVLAVFYALYVFAIRPQSVLQDGMYFSAAHAMEAEGRRPPPYARVRIFGSLGYLIPLLGFGALALLLRQRGGSMSTVWPMGVGALLCLAGVLCTWMLPPADAPAGGSAGAAGDKGVLPTAQAAAQLGRHRAWLLVWGMLAVQAGTVAYFSFQPQLLRDDYHLPQDWQSWVPAADVVLELLPMMLAPRFIRRFTMERVLLFSIAAQTLRFGLLAAAPLMVAPWCHWTGNDPATWAGKTPLVATLLVKALLHGPCVIGVYVVPPMLLNTMANSSCRHSVQALYTMLAVGGGVLLGNLVGGAVADRFSPTAVFWVSTAMVAAGGVLLLFWRRRAKANVERTAGLTPA